VSLKDQLEALDERRDAVEERREAVDERGGTAAYGLHGTVVQPRLLVGLTLIAAGLVWAALRGLEFYGLSPVNLAYDLDQPPLVLMLVGTWLLYRSRLK
jgi:hypothetical protein